MSAFSLNMVYTSHEVLVVKRNDKQRQVISYDHQSKQLQPNPRHERNEPDAFHSDCYIFAFHAYSFHGHLEQSFHAMQALLDQCPSIETEEAKLPHSSSSQNRRLRLVLTVGDICCHTVYGVSKHTSASDMFFIAGSKEPIQIHHQRGDSS